MTKLTLNIVQPIASVRYRSYHFSAYLFWFFMLLITTSLIILSLNNRNRYCTYITWIILIGTCYYNNSWFYSMYNTIFIYSCNIIIARCPIIILSYICWTSRNNTYTSCVTNTDSGTSWKSPIFCYFCTIKCIIFINICRLFCSVAVNPSPINVTTILSLSGLPLSTIFTSSNDVLALKLV